MIFLFTAVLIFFLLQIFALVKYFSKSINRKRSISNIYLKFSIIAAAKNEEKNISALIDSVRNINYPVDFFELIIVDDNSTDNTWETALISIKGESHFKIIKSDNLLPAKKGALSTGISSSKHNFIIITDADCVLPGNLLNEYNSAFGEGADFIFGFAPFTNEKNFTSRLSAFENLRSTILTFAFAEAGKPYSAAARNFGFKKSSFNKISGYKNTCETLSGDDDLLLREAVKNKMNIQTITSAKVFSRSENNLGKYLKQKTRHTKTSLYYLPGVKIYLTVWHLSSILLLFSPLFVFVNHLFIIPFILKIAADLFVVKKFEKMLDYRFSILEIVIYQILYDVLIIINFINALFKKDEWK
jgi:poly-beta-1,6-N-acetyl-D-glucosamine synthase